MSLAPMDRDKAPNTRVCVMGLGYIGLPTASLAATRGLQVYGVEIRKEIVEKINRGEIHIQEPDLDVLVRAAVHSGNLSAGLEPIPSDVFVITVPTPFKNGHVPDLTYVEAAARQIARVVQKENLVILESTSPVGTTAKVSEIIYSARPDLKKNSVFFAYCPERVLPGNILKELVENDRVVGGLGEESARRAKLFYSNFVRGDIFITTDCNAEMTKLVENAFRDVNIAFANELSMICDELKLDVWEVIRLANRHPRVKILNPGPGVGGHCIAVDPWFIVSAAPEQARLIRMARQVNDAKIGHVFSKIIEGAEQGGAKTIGCLGVTFKADVDDIRESPALEVIERLAGAFAGEILVADPYVSELPAGLRDRVRFVPYQEVLLRAEFVVLLVDHGIFKSIGRPECRAGTVLDTRGVWSWARK